MSNLCFVPGGFEKKGREAEKKPLGFVGGGMYEILGGKLPEFFSKIGELIARLWPTYPDFVRERRRKWYRKRGIPKKNWPAAILYPSELEAIPFGIEPKDEWDA